jgi:hypothetical protein
MLRTNVVGTTPPPGSGAQRCAQAGERENSIDSTAGTAAITAARSSAKLLMVLHAECPRNLFGARSLRRAIALATTDRGWP